MFRLSCLAFLIAVPGAAQQIPKHASAECADEIIRAYAASESFANFEYEHTARAPFHFFFEKGASGIVRELAQQKRSALSHLVDAFAERFGAGLGRARSPRPLIIWLVSDDNYLACGGEAHSSAHYDPAHRHVVVRASGSRGEASENKTAQRELLREIGRQLIDAWRDPKPGGSAGFDRPAVSAWLAYGVAEYLASVPPQARLREERDPGFRFLDERRIRGIARLCWKPLTWSAAPAIRGEHHPLSILSYATLADYMRATRADPDFDYDSQLLDFSASALATVAFLDIAFQEQFRKKLLALLKLEYSGTHGAAAFERVFPQSERARIKAMFDMFLWYPSAVASERVPKDVDKWVKFFAGGSMFDEKAKPWSLADVGVRSANTKKPLDTAIAESMNALRRYDVVASRAALGERTDRRASELHQHCTRLDRALQNFERAVRGKRVVMYAPPDKRRCRVLAFDRGRGRFTLDRGDTRQALSLREVPAPRLWQSIKIAREIEATPSLRSTFQLIAALQVFATPRERRVLFAKECKKHGIAAAEDRLRGVELQLRVLASFDAAKSMLETDAEVDTALAYLANDLADVREDPTILSMIAARSEALLERANDRIGGWPSGLGGRCEFLAEGRLRITYDWSKPAQAKDWVAVDKKDGFAPAHCPFSFGARLELDTKKGRARLSGGALRHRLQFLGDVSLRFDVTSKSVSATMLKPLDPGFFWLAALRPCTFIGGGPSMLEACFKQRVVARKRVQNPAVLEQFRDGGNCTLRLSGKVLDFAAGEKSIASITAPIVRGNGAVLWTPIGKPGQATIGKLVLEGTPHPKSVAIAKGRFFEAWWKRLRGKTTKSSGRVSRPILFDGKIRDFRAQLRARYASDAKDPWALIGLTELEGTSENKAAKAKALAHCEAFLALPEAIVSAVAQKRPAIRRRMQRYKTLLTRGQRLWALASLRQLESAARRAQAQDPNEAAQRRAAAINEARKAKIFAVRRAQEAVAASTPKRKRKRWGRFDRQIETALSWLCETQKADGSWDTPHPSAKVGVTGLALLALLAEGATPSDGPRAEHAGRAIAWLQRQQGSNGRIGPDTSQASVYGHAIASLALVEAWHRAPSKALAQACKRAIAHAEEIRNPYKVWRYSARDGANDTSVSSWMCAMLTAARARGFSVPKAPLKIMGMWLDELTDPSTGQTGYTKRGESVRYEFRDGVPTTRWSEASDRHTMTAAGLASRFLLGQARTPLHAMAGATMLKRLPTKAEPDYLCLHWGTIAMSYFERASWKAWAKAVAATLPSLQQANGSFDPKGRWSSPGGRAYATSLATMTMLTLDGRNLAAGPMLPTR